jgi:hypothetical protein
MYECLAGKYETQLCRLCVQVNHLNPSPYHMTDVW